MKILVDSGFIDPFDIFVEQLCEWGFPEKPIEIIDTRDNTSVIISSDEELDAWFSDNDGNLTKFEFKQVKE